MISVMTAIYNQLNVNKLYWESLCSYTDNPFEVIIIDNGSKDGSPEFFESVSAKVIYNNANYSYPYCQNQGIEAARYDWLAFMNFLDANRLIEIKDKWSVQSLALLDRLDD